MLDVFDKIEELLKEMIKGFNECELVIIVKNGKTTVVEKGKQVKHVKRVEFTDAIDEIPEIIIQKGVI